MTATGAPISTPRRLTSPLRQRVRRWWQSRLPLTDTWTLTQRNVYILPTRAGFMLALTLLLLLVASINYQLNLGYLLTFLLAGCAAVGMHVAHGTLRGLTLHLTPPRGHYAGVPVRLDVQLRNPRARTRHAIGLAVLDSGQWAWTDVPAQGEASVQVGFTPERRGLHAVPALTAETRFPLGTFRVWTVWRPAAQVLVYPAPEALPPPLPAGEQQSAGARTTPSAPTGDFDGVRAYRQGDPMKLVVWKRLARAGEMVSRDAQGAGRQELWLDFSRTGALAPEQRLSRLCAWVLAADRQGLDYGLRLPGLEMAPGQGEAHRRQCLEALARC